MSTVLYVALVGSHVVVAEEDQLAKPASHPALRENLPVVTRPLADGPHYFVHPEQGNDAAAGTEAAPWKSIAHGVQQLKPGDTLCLHGGIYYEHVYFAARGTVEQPITIRAYPGERPIVDGSWREFTDAPATAWEAFPDGEWGEFRSTKVYANARDVVGAFGDSMIGLQTYYHAIDLRSGGEFVAWIDPNNTAESDIKPLYCGPGLWYDATSGRIHCRLAHTKLPVPISNYAGETDPRKLPLVVAPFRSVPLYFDGASHVRIEGLTVRGGGYATVVIDQVEDIQFDRVTVWCSTYGLQISGTRDLKFLNSALYGSVAPWTFRGDGSKRDYPGRPHRNISRLNTHALVEIDSGGESSVFATPQNDRWEFAHCLFTDAHDGPYLGGINVRFHHNLIENLQDDGIYLSPMYLRHRLDKVDPEIHIYENVFRGMLTALAFGGSEPDTRDTAFVYRNIFDLTAPVQTGRPSDAHKPASISYGKLIGDHGGPPWCAMNFYHNTVVAYEPCRDAAMAALNAAHPTRLRRVFNNIFYHADGLSNFAGPISDSGAICDANLYALSVTSHQQESFFSKFRASPAFKQSTLHYKPGSTSNSLVADPQFERLSHDDSAGHSRIGLMTDSQFERLSRGGLRQNDYRLQKTSPAIDAGVSLPDDWPDPASDRDAGQSDIGAYPVGSPLLQVGPVVER